MWTRGHIEAHFLICYVSLVIMRLMQADVKSTTGKRPSDAAVQEALSNMVGHRLDANAYLFNCASDLTDALCGAVGIDLSCRVISRGQVRSLMAEVKKSRS